MSSGNVTVASGGAGGAAKPYTVVDKLTTECCPDTLEWSTRHQLLACCTYTLNKETGEKRGTVDLLRVDSSSPRRLQRVWSERCSAVFDGKWLHRGSATSASTDTATDTAAASAAPAAEGEDALFITAAFGGLVELRALQLAADGAASLVPVSSCNVTAMSATRAAATAADEDEDEDAEQEEPQEAPDSGVSATYVDAAPLEAGSSSERWLVVSRSDGRISLCVLGGSGIVVDRDWAAHALGGAPGSAAGIPSEVWVAAWNSWQPHTVWSGGDDAKLRIWDVRTDCKRAVTVSSAHEGGVTAISPCPHASRQHTVATGSYDECLLLWDDRNMSKPVVEHSPGGGVWRVRWRPQPTADTDTDTDTAAHDVAVACMYGGAHLLRLAPAGDAFSTVCSYSEHKSIVYASTWLTGAEGVGAGAGAGAGAAPPLLATCSFYENEVHLWQPASGVVS